MPIQIVHCIAAETIGISGNPRGVPDLGSIEIHNDGAYRVLRNIDFNGLIWWRCMVDATIAELKAWRNGGINRIGWLASGEPDATDIPRLWNGLWTEIQVNAPHDLWVVAPRLGYDADGFDLGPDVSDPTNPISITAFETVRDLDFGNYKDGWILWNVESLNSNAELLAWRDADPKRHGWRTANPPSGVEQELFIKSIAQAANNSQHFVGFEAAP